MCKVWCFLIFPYIFFFFAFHTIIIILHFCIFITREVKQQLFLLKCQKQYFQSAAAAVAVDTASAAAASKVLGY